jgi:ATP-grasp domain
MLGLDQPTLDTALPARDKRAMKSAVQARGVSCADFVSLRTSQVGQAVAATRARIGFPAVVKPAAGFGTLGTRWIHSARDLRNLMAEQGSDGLDHFLIAEEPVSGDEYHVDAVWVRGACKVLGVGRYLKPRIDIKTAGRDNGSVLLPPHDWPELYGDVAELHEKVNGSLGITDGITHMELFKRPGDRQLCFSEIATRFGGGAITQTFRVWGEDLRLTWVKSLFAPGRPVPYAAAAQAPYAGWINLAPEEAGRIIREPSDAEIAAFPYVLDAIRVHAAGDEFGDPHPSAWCLMLIAVADSLDQFAQRSAELEAALSAKFQVAKP